MSGQSFWGRLPIIGLCVSEWQAWRKEQEMPLYRLASRSQETCELPLYPLDMSPLLALPHGILDKDGVPYNMPTGGYPATYHPTTIAQYALAHWNVYLATKNEQHKQAFMTQARWLVQHEERFVEDAAGWPIPFPVPDYYTQDRWLSALTQGNGISVLAYAYRLTHQEDFLQAMCRAVRTFELDIRDGGVSTSIGEEGIFFEEVAAYPAAHILNGYLFALFGLYDYVAVTNDTQIGLLIQHSLSTLHTLIDEFDTGYWSRYDLLFKHPASRFYHSLHITMLEALTQYSGCEHCAALVTRWTSYQRSLPCRLRYLITSRFSRYLRKIRRLFLHASTGNPVKSESAGDEVRCGENEGAPHKSSLLMH